MSIHFILVLNRQGKSRLVKWFDNSYTPQQKQQYILDIHRLISSRDSKHQSNFVEFQQNKLVYRRYAGLYFLCGIDLIDSELSYLESLHFLSKFWMFILIVFAKLILYLIFINYIIY